MRVRAKRILTMLSSLSSAGLALKVAWCSYCDNEMAATSKFPSLDSINEDETVEQSGRVIDNRPPQKPDDWTWIHSAHNQNAGQQPVEADHPQPWTTAGFLATPTRYAVDTIILPALRWLSTGLEEGTSNLQFQNLRTVASAVQRRYWRLSKARDRELSLESELQYQWTTLEQQRAHLEESMQAFMSRLNSAKDKGSFKKSTAKLNNLCDRLQTDRVTVAEQAARTQRLEANRSVHLNHLQTLESELDSAVQGLLLLLNANSLVSADEDFLPEPFEPSVGSVKVASEESLELHPMLRHYYDKAGDVQVMRERLLEIVDIHNEEKGRREFLGDQDESLDLTDEEFEKLYAVDLEDAEQNLSNAVEACRAAEQACLEEGIEIPHAKRSQSYADDESNKTPVPYDRVSFSPPMSPPSTLGLSLIHI